MVDLSEHFSRLCSPSLDPSYVPFVPIMLRPFTIQHLPLYLIRPSMERRLPGDHGSRDILATHHTALHSYNHRRISYRRAFRMGGSGFDSGWPKGLSRGLREPFFSAYQPTFDLCDVYCRSMISLHCDWGGMLLRGDRLHIRDATRDWLSRRLGMWIVDSHWSRVFCGGAGLNPRRKARVPVNGVTPKITSVEKELSKRVLYCYTKMGCQTNSGGPFLPNWFVQKKMPGLAPGLLCAAIFLFAGQHEGVWPRCWRTGSLMRPGAIRGLHKQSIVAPSRAPVLFWFVRERIQKPTPVLLCSF